LTGVLAPLLLLSAINEWPSTISLFNTQLSFGNQAGLAILGMVLGLGFIAVGVGLFGALGHTWINGKPPSVARPDVVGLALGLGGAGWFAFASGLRSGQLPGWPSYGGAVSYIPWLSTALSAWVQILVTISGGLLLLGTLQRIRGTRWFWTAVPLVILVGFTLGSGTFGESWVAWSVGAATMSIGIWLIGVLCRHLGWAILPGVIAGPVLLGIVETAFRQPFPGNTAGAVLGLVGIFVVARVWTRAL
jgi:hypothetical protein